MGIAGPDRVAGHPERGRPACRATVATAEGRPGDLERVDLGGGSWVDLGRGWLPDGDALYAELARAATWSQSRLWRYERWIDEPRLGASIRALRGPAAEALTEARRVLVRHYRVDLDRGALAWYRDGRDGIGFHRDREMRYLDDTVVAILTLGGPRPFALRPRRGGEAGTRSVVLGSGDLLVMGGRAQADWLHALPYQHRLGVPGRMSVQWRWSSGRGRPEIGPSYRAPRTYSP